MATPPLTYLERKRLAGWSNSNHLVTGATQTNDRQRIQLLDKDTHRTITPHGHKTLMTIGRWLYWNVSAVRGYINEMADLAVESCVQQFEGEDQSWGEPVEQWMREHDKVCDVRGWPFNMATWRKNLVRWSLVDGGIFTIQTENEDGYPMIQTIPQHRVGSKPGLVFVQGGAYDGARIINGRIVNEYGRVIAYRVMGEDGEYGADFRDISARDMFESYIPSSADQCFGISELGASCFDWQDVKSARDFELISQKLAASIGLIETNETGEADKAKKIMQEGTRFSTSSAGTPTPLATTATETFDGVSVRYHRAGSGSKLEAFKADRPTANQQAFQSEVIREAMYGMGWSVDYSYNPTKIGGAPLRVVVDRLNRKLGVLREYLVKPAQVRIDGWRVAKVMDNPERTDKKLVLFPFNKDWWRWSYQWPAVLTADAKYNSDVDMQERRSGMKTLAKAAGERNEYWRDLRDQTQKETDDLLTRAHQLSTKHKISIETALTLLQDTTVYSTITNSADAQGEATAAAPAPAKE
jgi:hypothetical protein